MPIRLGKIPNSGGTAFLHTCEDCGAYACFGIGVSFNKALILADKGKLDRAKELLGKWYCLTHWRLQNEDNQTTEILA